MPRLELSIALSALVAGGAMLSPASAWALDVTAASGSAVDIQAAVDEVADAGGGTVFIPEGTFAFDDDVKSPDGVSLIGAGQDKTVLTGPGTIMINTRHYGHLGKPFRVAGLSILDSGAAGISIDTASEFRIDHCTVQTSGGSAIGVRNSTRGLIDHCTIDVQGNYYGVAISGSDVWEENIDVLLGSPEGIFVEDCEFFGQGHSVVGHGAAHYVFRHNIVHEADAHQIDAHGPGYGPDHGTRCVEVYGNTLEGPGWNGMGIRGGGGVIFDNLIEDHTHGVALVMESGSDTSSYPVPDQVHDMWIWDNTMQNVEVPVIVLSLGGVDGGTATAEQFIQQGRDYFLEAPPGYLPFEYPHPYQDELGGDLGSGGGSGGDGGSGVSSAGGAGSGAAGAGGESGDDVSWGPERDADEAGCGCRTAGAPARNGVLGLWLLMAVGAVGLCRGGRGRGRVAAARRHVSSRQRAKSLLSRAASRGSSLALLTVLVVLAALQLGCGDAGPDRDPDGSAVGGQAGTGLSGTGTGQGGTQTGQGGSTPVDSPPGTVDWTRAGYPGDIPDVGNVVDVTTVGAACNGVTDDHAAIQAAIDAASEPVVLRFPAGTCRIESPLSLQSGVVLQGAGSESTSLDCQSVDGCIEVAGSPSGDFVAVLSGLELGSSTIEVADSSGFEVGGGAQIQQDPYVPPEADWGDDNVGQMVRVVAIDGSTLTIDPPLHITYQAANNPEIRPIRFVEEVGIEDLTIRRIDAGGSSGNNISMRRVANSWIRRIESDFTEKYHVAISESVFLEVRDSYIHDAKSKGDGGQGYGASLGRHSTSILVENNIFVETRHAMIVQIGTNGCVFGYNYAERNYSDDGWDKTYISLHGHYPFNNLWEGNIVGYVGFGDYWGPAGPGNTLLRNRVLGTDKHETFGDYRGIDLEEYHGTQYLVGNEVMGEGIYGDLSDVVIHGNNVNGDVTWDPDMPEETVPSSYYLGQKPSFYGAMQWPSLGGDMALGEGSIPALARFLSGQNVPQP